MSNGCLARPLGLARWRERPLNCLEPALADRGPPPGATADAGACLPGRRPWGGYPPSAAASSLGVGVAALVAAYPAAAGAALLLASGPVDTPAWSLWPYAVWPAAGIGLAGLAVLGRRVWPAVLVGGFLAALAASGWGSVPEALGIAAGQTAGAFAGVTLLRARSLGGPLAGRRSTLSLVLRSAGAGTAVSAAVGTVVVGLAGRFPEGAGPLEVFGLWWIGEITGAVLVAPVLVGYARATPSGGSLLRRRRTEATAAFLLTGTAAVLLLRSSGLWFLLLFPLVLWPARRLGLPGAAVVNLMVVAAAVGSTARGRGPFAGLPLPDRIMALQAFDVGVMTVSLVVAMVSDACRRALREVGRSRDRMRRDLHDGLGPTLAAAILQLQVARDLVRVDPEAAEDLIGRLQAQARGLVEDVRRLTFGLGPQGLHSLGLLQAVKQRASHFARVPRAPAGGACPGTLQVTVEAAGDLETIPPAVELAAFHIVSEALNNASRHGCARTCSVALAIQDSSLVVEVSDDGRGLGAEFRPGLGLVSMRMRAEELGGACTVQDAPRGGTVVRARFPLTGVT